MSTEPNAWLAWLNEFALDLTVQYEWRMAPIQLHSREEKLGRLSHVFLQNRHKSLINIHFFLLALGFPNEIEIIIWISWICIWIYRDDKQSKFVDKIVLNFIFCSHVIYTYAYDSVRYFWNPGKHTKCWRYLHVDNMANAYLECRSILIQWIRGIHFIKYKSFIFRACSHRKSVWEKEKNVRPVTKAFS